MRRTARAIIIKDDQFLVMHRNKFGRTYFALVGGEVEPTESLEEALLREVKEESSLNIENPKLMYIEDAGEMYGIQYIYLCDYVSGEPRLEPNSIEAKISQKGKNLYIPIWLPLNELPEINLLSEPLKLAILDALKKGWPKQPINLPRSQ